MQNCFFISSTNIDNCKMLENFMRNSHILVHILKGPFCESILCCFTQNLKKKKQREWKNQQKRKKKKKKIQETPRVQEWVDFTRKHCIVQVSLQNVNHLVMLVCPFTSHAWFILWLVDLDLLEWLYT